MYNNNLYNISGLDVEDKTLKMWSELLDVGLIDKSLELLAQGIPKLLKVQRFLKELKK